MSINNQALENIIQGMVANNTNMPIGSPNHICQVTEITIRVGPPEGLRVINPLTTGLPCPPVCCCCCCRPCTCGPSAIAGNANISDESIRLLNAIFEREPDLTPERFLRELIKFK